MKITKVEPKMSFALKRVEIEREREIMKTGIDFAKRYCQNNKKEITMRKTKQIEVAKKLAVICFALMLGMLFLPERVYATGMEQGAEYVYGIDIPNSGEPGTMNNSRILADCAGGPHDLLAHGWGNIYNVDTGEYVVKLGACSQCTKCNLVVITQGEPGTGNPLGYYTSWQPNEPVPTGLVTINQNTKNIQYTSGTTIPGAKFRY